MSDHSGLNKGQKMVRLVEWMQRRGGIRVTELESSFDLDPRSLRRYLSDLRDLGLPVCEEGRGDERTVYLDPAYRRAGVRLNLGEMISLRFGRTLFNFLEGTGFAEDLNQAIDRLQPTMSRGNADMVQQLDHTFVAGYSNGHLGYAPTADAYEDQSYEDSLTPFAPQWQEIYESKAMEIIAQLGPAK